MDININISGTITHTIDESFKKVFGSSGALTSSDVDTATTTDDSGTQEKKPARKRTSTRSTTKKAKEESSSLLTDKEADNIREQCRYCCSAISTIANDDEVIKILEPYGKLLPDVANDNLPKLCGDLKTRFKQVVPEGIRAKCTKLEALTDADTVTDILAEFGGSVNDCAPDKMMDLYEAIMAAIKSA